MIERPRIVAIGLIVILLGVPGVSTAQAQPNPPPFNDRTVINNTSVNTNVDSNTNTSTNRNRNIANGGAGGAASTGNQIQTLTTNSSGGSSGVVPANQSITGWIAPPVYAPSVVGGNLCAIGASGGVTWMGAGFALGASWESANCERRQLAALLHNAGLANAAKELLCDQQPVYEAMRRAGTPCIARPAWDGPQMVAASPPPALRFYGTRYASTSDCITAAVRAGLTPGAEIAAACPR